ncbi:MAG: diguanylate cyclase [Bauldia litoralis]
MTIDSASWSGLLANVAIIAILISVWTQSQTWTDRWPKTGYLVLLSVMASAGTLAVMNLPFEIQPGVNIDLRTTLIAISGFFGGPLVGLATGIVAAAYRFYLGGAGWPAGLVGIGIAAGIGTFGHLLLRGRNPDRRDVLVLAAALAFGGLFGFLFLPASIWLSALAAVGIPIVILIFVSTTIAGLAIVQETRRRVAAAENQIYRAIIDSLPDSLNAKDLDGRFTAANPRTAELMMAESPQALVGRTDFDFYPAETAKAFRADEEKVIADGKTMSIEQRLVHRDGSKAWLSTMKVPLRDDAGKIIGLITHNRDITDRKHLETEFAESQRRLSDALTFMADGLVMFDKNERLVFCNEQYRTLFPKTADLRVPGAQFRDLLRATIERGEQGGVEAGKIEEWIDRVAASLGKAGDQEIQLVDGRWLHARVRPIADGASLSVISDITHQKQAEASLSELNERLEALARTDALTGLLNRRAFDEALEHEFRRGARTAAPLSLLMIDVDHFKAFNDTYGHPAGDDCLRKLAQCLQQTIKRPADTAARYGGEELAAILPDTSPEGAVLLAEDFRNAVRELAIPHSGSDKGIVTVSIGVSTLGRGSTIGAHDDLVHRADEALYAAKEAGRDRVQGGRPTLAAVGTAGRAAASSR